MYLNLKNGLLLSIVILLIPGNDGNGQAKKYNDAGAGNPVIPGYFADPTVKKFGDMYYIYATTDGTGAGLGPSQVWVSKDFVNWTNMPMNWPVTPNIWAPDVMLGKDGKYYMYYCEPCRVYCGVSETPRGPWKNYLGNDTTVLIPDRLVKNVITLDGQSFVDDDGSIYLYWGTWGIYKDFGCGVGKLNPDLKSFSKTQMIPNTQATDFFEGPFMFKRNGIYYFTYSSGSCFDATYRVQYAASKTGPMGPFEFAPNNPILSTNADSTVHGPGHHSILKEGDDYYIVYHRHNIPNATRGFHRQIAADRLRFDQSGQIQKVAASHDGVGYLRPSANPFPNLAFGKKVTASSYYSEHYKPAYAVDDNNATLWRPKTAGREWLEIDLGSEQPVKRVWTQFEYATSFYQYIIMASKDGENWFVYSDKSNNTLVGSPMVDYGDVRARYIRLTILGGEQTGKMSAVWNIKIFSDSKTDPPQRLVQLTPSTFVSANNRWMNGNGMLGGYFSVTGEVSLQEKDGREAIVLSPNSFLESSFILPQSFCKLQPYTVTFQVYGSKTQVAGTKVEWNHRTSNVAIVTGNDSPQWHWVALSSDGMEEHLLVDGEIVRSVRAKKEDNAGKLRIITDQHELILASFRVYNWQQSIAEIRYDAGLGDQAMATVLTERMGKIIDISADDYYAGSCLRRIENRQGIPGGFNAANKNLIRVERKENRKAFVFTGKEEFRSDFQLPSNMTGCSPYTITAWVLNPELAENEYFVDLNPAGGELEKVYVGLGTEKRFGIVGHNGWYEDVGMKTITSSNGWRYIAVTFDGFVEKVYLDDQLISSKDILLLLPASPFVTLGRLADRNWPFTGWLGSLKVYDIALDEAVIHHEFLNGK